MSGENVPYHLRPNKFVERLLFIDLLSHISHYKDLKNYAYISMGGKYLEDFKLVHEMLAMRELYSIEMDPVTYGRQRFNRPLTFIECINKSATDFLKTFELFQDKQDGKGVPQTILWLDFANAKGRGIQLRDFETAIGKLVPFDIAKITLNANVSTILPLDYDELSDEEIVEHANEKLRKTLADYRPPEDVDKSNLHDRGFAELLIAAADRAGLKGLKNKRGCILHPLSAFQYRDGHHSMVTYTVMILPKTEVSCFETKSRLASWPYYYNEEFGVRDISVPDLSLKERMFINDRLFLSPAAKLHRNLPFKLDKSREVSLSALNAYIEHYRRYPTFVRATI